MDQEESFMTYFRNLHNEHFEVEEDSFDPFEEYPSPYPDDARGPWDTYIYRVMRIYREDRECENECENENKFK